MSDCTFADTVFNFSLHLRLMERPAMIFQQQQQQEEVEMEVKEQRRRLVLHCSRLAVPLPPCPPLLSAPPCSSSIHSNHSQMLLITFLTGFLWSFCFCFLLSPCLGVFFLIFRVFCCSLKWRTLPSARCLRNSHAHLHSAPPPTHRPFNMTF